MYDENLSDVYKHADIGPTLATASVSHVSFTYMPPVYVVPSTVVTSHPFAIEVIFAPASLFVVEHPPSFPVVPLVNF